MDVVAITTLVVTSLGLLLGFFQSIKSNHFQSSCCDGFFTMDNQFIGKDNVK